MTPPPRPRHRRVIVLGSTGSIGVNTLEVVAHLRRLGHDLEVVGLAAGHNADRVVEQAERFGVKHLAMAGEDAAAEVRDRLPDRTVHVGDDAAEALVREVDATDVVAAIVGAAGLGATLTAARLGRTISLANKETLVAAGPVIAPLVGAQGTPLLPVDSEHSAIFQCLQGRAQASDVSRHKSSHNGRAAESRVADLCPLISDVKRIVLTASGGPFRTADPAAIRDATPEQALKHPTWSMGPKITIDSATMMNKALELIEAHWLFRQPADKLGVIIHPQSIVHSFVEFADHSTLAQLGPPDMKTPIQYALTWPDRPAGCSAAMDWAALSRLDFEPPDPRRFPALGLAYRVIEAGGNAGAVFNAANEAAVAAFLERRVRFGRIVELVAEALDRVPVEAVNDLDDVVEADRAARAVVGELIGTE